MLKSIPAARAAVLAALVFSAGCTDRSPTESIPTPGQGERVRAEIACTVTVASARVTCGAPGPVGGASANVILGGQNKYLRLESSSLAYDGAAQTFTVDVTVFNLLGQKMGTPDGVTATGVRVFFDRLPTATSGSGEVTVDNPDGYGGFTGLNQPYFEYPEILEPVGSSRPRTWRFKVPNTVVSFGFSVYVDTELPAEQGVLRWLREEGSTAWGGLGSFWGTSSRAVFATGSQGTIMFYDGERWNPMITGARRNLWDIWGSSRTHVLAVGDSGAILRYDGNRWDHYARGVDGRRLFGVWTNGPTAFAVGWQRNTGLGRNEGLLLVSADSGHTWSPTLQPADGPRTLQDVFASPDGQTVFVTGYQTNPGTGRIEGILQRSTNGGGTWTETLFSSASDSSRWLVDVWTDGAAVLVAGYDRSLETFAYTGFVLRSTDGGESWTREDFPGQPVYAVWGYSASDMYAGVVGAVQHYDGTGWSQQIADTEGYGAVWGPSPDTLIAGAQRGGMAVKRGTEWTRYASPDALTHLRYGAAWGWDNGEMMVLAERFDEEVTGNWWPVVRRRSAAGQWEDVMPMKVGWRLSGIWSSTPNDVVVVGDSMGSVGLVLRWNGASWSRTDIPQVSPSGVWGDRQGTLHVVGALRDVDQYGVHLRSTDNGESWTEVERSFSERFNGVWGDAQGQVYIASDEWGQPGGRAVLRTRRNGYLEVPWWSQNTPGRMLGVRIGPGGEIFAYGTLAGEALVITSLDGGQTFTPSTFPARGPGNGSSGFTLGALWAGEGVAYAVGAGGPILQYSGGAWKSTETMYYNTALGGVWGMSPTDVYVFGEQSTVLHGTR